MASFTLLPLEILLKIRSHLVKPRDILTLTTLTRNTYMHIDLLLYSSITIHHSYYSYRYSRDSKDNLRLSDLQPIDGTLWKLERALKHETNFISSLKKLDIHLHTSLFRFMSAGAHIYELLPRLDYLKHFRLITEVLNEEACSPERDKISPARLVIALKGSTYKTLETLELALGCDRHDTDGTQLGDMKSFVALKKLSVQSYVLLGGYNVKGVDYNPNTWSRPMLSEMLPASLLHLRIHCGAADMGTPWDAAESDNYDSTEKHQRRDRDEVVAHLTEPVNWGPIKWGHHDETFQPLEEMDAKVVRVLKSARNCMCPHGDYWREVKEMTRLVDRLDVIGED